jgi:hypothetical protein
VRQRERFYRNPARLPVEWDAGPEPTRAAEERGPLPPVTDAAADAASSDQAKRLHCRITGGMTLKLFAGDAVGQRSVRVAISRNLNVTTEDNSGCYETGDLDCRPPATVSLNGI